MKASELRIGNWVEFIQPKKGMYTTVQAITFEINVEKSFKPIPLTEEWLLKFGFEERGESFHLKDFSIELIGEDGRWCTYIFDEYHAVECSLSLIKYVHSLQNLYFALTGEELTLKE